MKVRAWAALVLATECALAARAVSSELPQCAGPVEVASADIVRVEKNAALILRDGRAARLEGVRLPAGAIDHGPQFLSDQALAALAQLTVGHQPVLTALSPKEDRYDRIRAQVF